MREIKFRAWCPYKESMAAPAKIYEIVTSHKFFPSQSFDYLMQYTGLKDKNGVEIYESDLVKTEKGIFQLTIDCFGPELSGYDNGDYYYGDVSEYHNWNEFEVIGNIYENPDLLEEE